MSNPQVIAAATATLRLLLSKGIPKRDAAITSLEVTTLPLDRVGADMTKPALNLFLYQTSLNAAWSNRDATRARPGEAPLPPAALNLHYLLTSYGPVDVRSGDFSHRVLGAAVSVLHDHPVLSTDAIVGALSSHPALRQVERMRISPLAMTIEEMSKLWTVFQTNYRLSAAYEVSVALIESERPVGTPLPVLRRGRRDRGAIVLASPLATLTRAVPPRGQAAVRLGETLGIEGQQLDQGALKIRVASPLLSAPKILDPLPGGREDRIEVVLPHLDAASVMSDWAPGFYTAAVVQPQEDLHDLVSNAVPFAIAPTIKLSTTTPPAGPSTLTLSVSPRLRPAQGAVLLMGRHTVREKSRTQPNDATQPTACDFEIRGVAAEEAVVRLRADGVDSVPIGADPLVFDPQQTLVFQ